MNVFIFYFLVVTIIGSTEGKCSEKIKKIFEWSPGKIEFVFENKKLLQYLLATGKFIPKNNVPLGLAVDSYKKKMFVTVPRWKQGVLSTLNWVPIGTGNLNEPLRPYPCWEANDIYGNSKFPYKIISVIRVFVDSCDRLWVVDSGYDNKMINRTQIEPPKILIFDIIKNELIRKYTFDSTVTQLTKSSLGKVVVDVTPETCDEAFAYITDSMAPGLIVYDYFENRAFRIEHNYLMLEPLQSAYYVQGKKFYSNVNIDGISLSGPYTDGYRNLYLNPQASNKQFITTTKFLRNESYCGSGSEIIYYLGERYSDCQVGGGQVVDEKTGVMFYSELNSDAIGCWNGDHSKFGPQTQQHVAVSPELKYVSDLVITPDRELAAMSCQLREFFNSDEGVTSRVFVGIVDSLIEGTICSSSSSSFVHHHHVSESACCQKYEDPIN